MRYASKSPIRITRATIEAEWRRRKADACISIRDDECRGLALVVNPTTMVWRFSYRGRGIDPLTGKRFASRTVTLGNPETHSPEDARKAANALKGQIAGGADPAAERRAKAEEERRKRAATLGRLLEEYAKHLPKRQKMRGSGVPSVSYVAEEVAQVRLALADLAAESKPAAELEVRHIVKLASERTGIARKRFGAVSRFLDWCVDAEHIHTNPCALITRSRRPKAPQARAHYLTPAELARLWHAAERLEEHVWRDFARFLIAVPCRRNEAARLSWSHVDLAAAEWRQPGKLTKNRDPHRLYVHPLALEVLRERYKTTGGKGLVFPAPLSGKSITTFSQLKRHLEDATKPKDGEEGAALSGWTWHDFRRSFATALGEAGIPETVADAVLNHRQSATRGGVLGVYQRASRWPEQVQAMQLWGRMLSAAIEGRETGAEVVPLRARAG